MPRLSLKHNTETKEYDWKLLDEKKPGLLVIETNKGVVTIPNYPSLGEPKTVGVVTPEYKEHIPNGGTFMRKPSAEIYQVYPFVVHRWSPDGHKWTKLSDSLQRVREAERYKNDHSDDAIVKHPMRQWLWTNIQVAAFYNPVRREWLQDDSAAFDVIEHDIIEHVTKTIPQMNAAVIEHVAERESVGKTFCDLSVTDQKENK